MLLNGSDVAWSFGFRQHNFMVLDHTGEITYKSDGFLSRRYDDMAVRGAIQTALEAFREEAEAEAEPETTTGVRELGHQIVPDDFRISQNYPNPFNGGTAIQFSLPWEGEASFTVFDVRGARVRQLMRRDATGGRAAAGRYEVTWDGRGDDGQELASGIYVYRLEWQGRRISGRMSLVR